MLDLQATIYGPNSNQVRALLLHEVSLISVAGWCELNPNAAVVP